LYPPEKVAVDGGYEYLRAEIAKMGPWSALEKKAAVLLAVAILLWLTDFIHHISPAIIGIGVGLFALLPRVGILDIEDMKRLNYLPVFFVAAAVSMGTVLEVTKGLEVLTKHVRLDAALHDKHLLHDHRHVLDRVRLSLPVGERDFDARHFDAASNGIRQIS
jgi:di/tricarboxylate transporter